WCCTVAWIRRRSLLNAATAMLYWLRQSWTLGLSRRQLAVPSAPLAPASPDSGSLSASAEPVENHKLPGQLIIVEGIDGSGKSTQLDLLRKWLVNQGYLVIFSEWNSSPIVKGITRLGKRRQLLSPMSFSLIHAADFASRTHSQIMPALRSGAIVLADRYVYTAYARDAVRGVDRDWVRRVYSFAVPPTLPCYSAMP